MNPLAVLLLLLCGVVRSHHVDSDSSALKHLVCKMGRHYGVECDSVKVTTSDDHETIAIKFNVGHKEGYVHVTNGCNDAAQAFVKFYDAFWPQPTKEKIIEVFQTSDIISQIDSEICTVISGEFPESAVSKSQFFRFDCELDNKQCVSFKSRSDGQMWMKIMSQKVETMFGTQKLGFMIEKATQEIDIRTATVPNQPTFHAVPLPGQPESGVIDTLNKLNVKKMRKQIENIREELMKGESDPNHIELWKLNVRSSFGFQWIRDLISSRFNPILPSHSSSDALKHLVCEMGIRYGIECESVQVMDSSNDKTIDIKFQINKKDGYVVVTKGCKEAAPAFVKFHEAFSPVPNKQKIIDAYTTRELVSQMDSQICTIVRGNFPESSLGSPSFKFDCELDNNQCFSFKSNANGVWFMKIESQKIETMFENKKIAFLIKKATMDMNVRTATITKPPTFHAVSVSSGNGDSDVMNVINEMNLYQMSEELETVREVLIEGESDPNHVELWKMSSLSNAFFVKRQNSEALKHLVCHMGLRHRIQCDSVQIMAPNQNDHTIEIRFKIDNQNGHVVVTEGCQDAAPALIKFNEAFQPVPDKQKIINVYTTPEWVSQMDSQICTIVRGEFPGSPTIGSNSFKFDCELDNNQCLSFKSNANGVWFMKIESQKIETMFENKKIAFLIKKATMDMNVRTATITKPPTFHAVSVSSGNGDSDVMNVINQMNLYQMSEELETVRQVLIEGESDPNHVELWKQSDIMRALVNNEREDTEALKQLACQMGLRHGVDCDSIRVMTANDNDETIEIRFKMNNHDGHIVVTKGCQAAASSLIRINEAFIPVPNKQKIINVFTTPELISQMDSHICTIVDGEFPGSAISGSQLFKFSCELDNNQCLSFKSNANGVWFMKIESQKIETMFENKKIAFLIKKATMDMNVRTATITKPPTFHAVSVSSGNGDSDVMNVINQMNLYQMREELETVRQVLIEGESDPNHVELWKLSSLRKAFFIQRYGHHLTFERMMCDFLEAQDLSCDSLHIEDKPNDRFEVTFDVKGSKAMIVLKSGCMTAMPTLYEVISQFGSTQNEVMEHLKEVVITLFTTPELLEKLDSDVCTIYEMQMPNLDHPDQFNKMKCESDKECLTFKAKKEGTMTLNIKDMEQHLSMGSLSADFIADASITFDFRTAKVPEEAHNMFVARTMNGQSNSPVIDVLNKMIPQVINHILTTIHSLLVKDEADPDHVSLWPYQRFFDSAYFTESETLKDVLCELFDCETVQIEKLSDKDILKVLFGHDNTQFRIQMSSECENLFVDMFSLFKSLPNPELKEFLIALFASPELLDEINNDQCSIFSVEVMTTEDRLFVSCSNDIPCLSFSATPEGLTTLSSKKLTGAMSPRWSANSENIDFVIPELTVSYNVRTASIPNDRLPVVMARPMYPDATEEQKGVLEILNSTATYVISNWLQTISRVLRCGERYPYHLSLWSYPSRTGIDRTLETDQPDLMKMFSDVMNLVSEIPKCAQDLNDACCEEFEHFHNRLLPLDNNMESVIISRLISLVAEESHRLCETAMTVELFL